MANPTFKSIINRSTGGSKALLYLRGWAWRLDRSVHDSVTVGESCDKSLVLLLPTTSRYKRYLQGFLLFENARNDLNLLTEIVSDLSATQ
ncbi:hypothetical protein PSHT_11592 [Puccinia striiformis]|uniref:Uncharacterized protein n=1 Tax=Puccinia striiformis TaxID=27350 RepID=A0A2S4V2D3_9BASI|nr:hypothetical protein PSHT_11592 [Puccinia striiformis]